MKLKILIEEIVDREFSDLAYTAIYLIRETGSIVTITRIAEVFKAMYIKNKFKHIKDTFGFKEYVDKYGLESVFKNIKKWWYDEYKQSREFKRYHKYKEITRRN